MAVLDELLVRLGVDMSGAEQEIDAGSQEITNRLDGLAVAGTIAGAGLGAAFAMGLESAMDISSATGELQNQLGITHDDAVQLSEATKSLFSSGLAGSVEEANAAVIAVKSSFGDMKDASVADVAGVAEEVTVLAKKLKVDVSDAANAAGTMVKNGLAKNSAEAMDMLAQASDKGANQFGDLTETITKSANNLAHFGLTGEQAMGVMVQGIEAGAPSAELLAGALEEMAANAADGAETFDSLGLNGKQMAADFAAGGPAAGKALDQLLDKLRTMDDDGERSAAMVSLFGEEALTMQDALLKVDPSTASAKLGDFAGAAGRAADAAKSEPAVQLNKAMNTLRTTLGEALLPVLTTVSEFMAAHPGLIQVLIPVVLALAAALGIAAIAQWAMNSALLANPITLVILAIIALVAVLVLAWKKSETFRAVVLFVWNAVKESIMMAVRAIMAAISWLSSIPSKVSGWFTQAKDWAIKKLQELLSWLSGLPGRVSRAVSGLFDGLPKAFRGAVNSVIGAWNNLSFTIGGGSIMGVSIPSITLGTPNIPYLAEGGIATAPTLAMVGEGRESEAIMPLSKLEQLLRLPGSAPSTGKVQPFEARYVLAFEGGADDKFVDFLQEITRKKGGGSIAKLAGEV
jgi:hypothetical protein